MNIGIVGYGRMGREVETQARTRGHTISCVISPTVANAKHTSLGVLPKTAAQTTDIFIEFSLPHAVFGNVQLYAREKKPCVIGTTGWDEFHARANTELKAANIACVYGSNFSVGAHIFARVCEYAAGIVNTMPHYDAALWESHHAKKKDRPSGTALMTARRVLSRLTRKTGMASDLPADTPPDPKMLAVVSQRVGFERGFHELILDSDFDTVKISHTARSRAGFALGAVLAAEWLAARKANSKQSTQSAKTASQKNALTGLLSIDTFIDDIIFAKEQDAGA